MAPFSGQPMWASARIPGKTHHFWLFNGSWLVAGSPTLASHCRLAAATQMRAKEPTPSPKFFKGRHVQACSMQKTGRQVAPDHGFTCNTCSCVFASRIGLFFSSLISSSVIRISVIPTAQSSCATVNPMLRDAYGDYILMCVFIPLDWFLLQHICL